MAPKAQLSRPLDDVDRRIIALLRENAKLTFAQVGEQVSLSATAVKRRVDRLERDGVIVGYAAIVEPNLLGAGVETVMEIYCADRTSPADMHASLHDIEEIVTAFTVSGDADALVRARVESIDHLEKLVERLRRDPNIVRTRTMIVLSTIIDRTARP